MQLPPRSRSQRKADALDKLRTEVDLWVASASEDAQPYLVPLSYSWDGSKLTVATARASRTAKNLIRSGRARAALGPTRDVVIIEGSVEAIVMGADPVIEERHAQATGFDPRNFSDEYIYFRITPRDPGVARIKRTKRPPADATGRVARLTSTTIARLHE